MSLLGILTALPWGTLLGGVMGWLQRREELKRMQIEHAQRVEFAKLAQAGAISAAEWAGFNASHDSAAREDASGVWPWVKSIRYGMRSFLTLLLVLAAVIIAFRSGDDSLPPRIVFFAEMALGWHFGWKAPGASAAVRQSTK